MINADRLTVKAAEAFNEAIAMARRNGNPLVYDGQLFLALLGQDEGIVIPLLHKLGANVAELRAKLEREVDRYPKQSGGAQPFGIARAQPGSRQGRRGSQGAQG